MYIHPASPYKLAEYNPEISGLEETSFERTSYPGVLEWVIAEAIAQDRTIFDIGSGISDFTLPRDHVDYDLNRQFRLLLTKMILGVSRSEYGSVIPRINHTDISLAPILCELFDLTDEDLLGGKLPGVLVPSWRKFFKHRKITSDIGGVNFEVPSDIIEHYQSDTLAIEDICNIMEVKLDEIITTLINNLYQSLIESKPLYEVNDLCSKAESFLPMFAFPSRFSESIQFYRGTGNFKVDSDFVRMVFDDNLRGTDLVANGKLYWAVKFFYKSANEGVIKACRQQG